MTPIFSTARRRGRWVSLAAVLIATLAGTCAIASGASAQSSRCAITTYTDPPREVLHCPNGLSVSAERSSDYRLVDRDRDGSPDAAELTSRGLLIESPPKRGRFQILTPHAIATVRGTVWAVDVTAVRTSVFVKRGTVEVARPGSRDAVTLRAGDGVDVEQTGGLQAKRWSSERALLLLGRFGR
jgi:ferric-dicitrate binding protein FerR (iron transport regulator)